MIPPGEEGKVAIKVNTKGYGGRTLKKYIYIITNDDKNSKLKLTVTGEVESFALINPKKIKLRGSLDKPVTASVKIIPKKKYPFKIISTRLKKEGCIKYDLKKINGSHGHEYLLYVENIKKKKGRYFNVIYLTTDSKIKHEIKISVYGDIFNKNMRKGKN